MKTDITCNISEALSWVDDIVRAFARNTRKLPHDYNREEYANNLRLLVWGFIKNTFMEKTREDLRKMTNYILQKRLTRKDMGRPSMIRQSEVIHCRISVDDEGKMGNYHLFDEKIFDFNEVKAAFGDSILHVGYDGKGSFEIPSEDFLLHEKVVDHVYCVDLACAIYERLSPQAKTSFVKLMNGWAQSKVPRSHLRTIQRITKEVLEEEKKRNNNE
jgi:hypothetical protein